MDIVKLQYLVRGEAAEPPERFAARIRDGLVPRLLGAGPAALTVTMTDREPPRFSPVPYGRDRLALVSLHDRGAAGEAVGRWNGIMAGEAGIAAGYRVSESRPRDRRRHWPAGTASPGLGMITLFRGRPGLSRESFIQRWHEGHSPLALRVHPLCHYVRNVVDELILPASPTLDGIVEEFCATDRELLHLRRFFGGTLRMLPNMIAIGLDIRKWMDLGSIENYLAREYRFLD